MPKKPAKTVAPVVTKPSEPERVILAEVPFEGIVGKHKQLDTARIHCTGLKEAKEIFMRWVSRAEGIRGESGIFHPLAGYGDIRIKGNIIELRDFTPKGGESSGEESGGEVPSGSHDKEGS